MPEAPRSAGLFAFSDWDAAPALAGVLHFAYLIWMAAIFPTTSFGVMVLLGAIYAVSISWNINGISHNFLHNPFFVDERLNRAFSLLLSLTMFFSQAFYEDVHTRHHIGNGDRRDGEGKTVDPLSIYGASATDRPENVWRYTFLSFFRDDVGLTWRHLKRRYPANAQWGLIEIACVVVFVIGLLMWDWTFVIFLLPFYYLGNALSSLNGYFEHLGSNPDVPLAWGVSSYNRLYNLIWFNNGYHAEHHYRPRHHWTKMEELRLSVASDMAEAGTHVISTSHALGYFAKENQKLLADLGML